MFAALGSAGVAATAGCVTVERPPRTGSWPRPGYTDGRTNRTDVDGPTGFLYPAWVADTAGGYPPTTPVVADDTVFVLQSNYADDPRRATVVAYDGATGDRRWETTLLRRSTSLLDVHFDSLCLDSGTLYAQTVDGVHALTPTDGTRLWTVPVPTAAQPWPRAGAPVVHDGTLVAGTYGDRDAGPELRGFDPATGEQRWRRRLPSFADLWTLAAAAGTVYAPFLGDGASSRGVVALDAATGEVAWESSLPVDGPLTVADDRLVVPLGGGDRESVAVVDRVDRTIQWREPARRRTDAGFAVAGGRLFYAADDVLAARRLDTGEQVWSFGNDRRVVDLSWTPIVAGDVVYAMAAEPTEPGSPSSLFALGTDDGAIYGSGRVEVGSTRSSLAVVEGAAYIADGNEVRCYESCVRSAFDRCVLG
nr:PQQ-binding-like beta-propeller repeat protein [Salinigranum salinum]